MQATISFTIRLNIIGRKGHEWLIINVEIEQKSKSIFSIGQKSVYDKIKNGNYPKHNN
jgi:hypothetical protein